MLFRWNALDKVVVHMIFPSLAFDTKMHCLSLCISYSGGAATL
jgi:hypothetical protein